MIIVGTFPFYEVIREGKVIGVCKYYDFITPVSKDNGLRYGIISEAEFRKYKKNPWADPKSKEQFGRPIVTSTKQDMMDAQLEGCCGFAN